MDWKNARKYGGFALGAILIVLFLVFVAPALVFVALMAGSVKDVERYRVHSPNGSIEAVVVDRFAPATDPDSVLIYIVPSNAKVKGDPLVQWANAAGVEITWSGDATVLFHADSARTYSDKNFDLDDRASVGGNTETTVRVQYHITNLERR